MSSTIAEGAGPRLVSYPVEGAFRVTRREEPLGPSWISAPDAQMSSGNRYDIAGGGVLYCATQLEASPSQGARPLRGAVALCGC